MRRFLQHVLRKGLHKVRYGLSACGVGAGASAPRLAPISLDGRMTIYWDLSFIS